MCKKTRYARFVERDSNIIKIEVEKQLEEYEILKVVEFDSDRKRMSVVVKRQADGKVFNFIKGADLSIIPRLSENAKIAAQPDVTAMNEMASEGLRTLMFAMKELDSNANVKELSADELETDIEVLGVTGLQDLL
jgi:P-type E1-E2 ATPase